MNLLLRHLELIFTAAGLLVIVGVTLLVHPTGVGPWTVAAITATVVGLIHGALFWIVRQRQRLVRLDALNDTQRMLRDVVINQLAIIRINAELQNQTGRGDTVVAIARLEKAMATIDQTLNDISEESLSRWRSRYNFPTTPFTK
jgi:hypothetical protein